MEVDLSAAGSGDPDVWALVRDERALDDDTRHMGGWMPRMCRAAARELGAAGVGVSVMTPQGDPAVLATSGVEVDTLEQLQFTLGEGPCLDSLTLGRPVLTPDLVDAARTRWPGYAPAVQEHSVNAVFAFPLQLGAAQLGAMDVYRDRAGSLTPTEIRLAVAFAEAAMVTLLDAQEQTGPDVPAFGTALDGRFVVFQAQGMVQVQLGVSLEEALARLRAHAYATGRTLSDVAADVAARRLKLEPDS
ncbi:GAF and ANTAR domain-containing protein [Nocardioides sp. MAHUQ-72]|uniref:GAF and ANTAR domain-containing protein n=1 Tax=unclassified Nocardioides TaxID=2615069 RepID=UPI0036198561